jgi:hypothetical protein
MNAQVPDQKIPQILQRLNIVPNTCMQVGKRRNPATA